MIEEKEVSTVSTTIGYENTNIIVSKCDNTIIESLYHFSWVALGFRSTYIWWMLFHIFHILFLLYSVFRLVPLPLFFSVGSLHCTLFNSFKRKFSDMVSIPSIWAFVYCSSFFLFVEIDVSNLLDFISCLALKWVCYLNGVLMETR